MRFSLIPRRLLHTTKPWLIPCIIVATALAVSVLLTALTPGPTAKTSPNKPMLVTAQLVEKSDITITVPSQGRVTPHIRTQLTAEVSGSVIEVSDRFVSGGFVSEGQLLLKLDDRNYRAAVKRAEAEVARANKTLIQEKGKAQVAYSQWQQSKNIKRSEEALSLLLHKPQLEEAEANLAFAKAELERANGDLQKTEIRAPYDGLIKKKYVDLAQYATAGTHIADLIAIDYAEVRLAIPQDRLAYLDLAQLSQGENDTSATARNDISSNVPEKGEHAATASENKSIPVILKSFYGNVENQWPAKLVRTEGFFDETNHTLYAVVHIEDPYTRNNPERALANNQPPLLMGTYVEAAIQGKHLEDIVSIPRHVLRAGNHIWVIDKNNQLRNRQIEILRVGGENIYVTGGLESGERICLTNVGEVVPGTTVRIQEESEALLSQSSHANER